MDHDQKQKERTFLGYFSESSLDSWPDTQNLQNNITLMQYDNKTYLP